jgi:hypothetical protein
MAPQPVQGCAEILQIVSLGACLIARANQSTARSFW